MEDGMYNKEREQAQRKKMTVGGKGNVVGCFPYTVIISALVRSSSPIHWGVCLYL